MDSTARFENGTDAGAVYVFERNANRNWVEVDKLMASDGAARAYLGWAAVDVFENTIVVGSPRVKRTVYTYTRNNRFPALTVNQTNITIGEGVLVTNSGSIFDADGDYVALNTSVGTIQNNGDGTWTWHFTPEDGPTDSQPVVITADDGKGGSHQATFDLIVNNAAPVVDAGLDTVIAYGEAELIELLKRSL